MVLVESDRCRELGIDENAVTRIAKRLDRAAEDAYELGLTVFGGTGSGSLRLTSEPSQKNLVASISGGTWDGGDGDDWEY